jgi:hypothetical protein
MGMILILLLLLFWAKNELKFTLYICRVNFEQYLRGEIIFFKEAVLRAFTSNKVLILIVLLIVSSQINTLHSITAQDVQCPQTGWFHSPPCFRIPSKNPHYLLFVTSLDAINVI